ncbi:MAG: HD domain-containing protein, partial [bacterium]|nr:HD domain-containing protein [bacterium]
MNPPRFPDYTYLSDNVLYALEFASVAHQTQMRKGAQHIPYISHPAMVGSILARAGFPEETIIAGILHDVIEDTSYGYEYIAENFGKDIAGHVQCVSEDKSLNYITRKQLYLENLKNAPDDALAVSMADSMANLMSICISAAKYDVTLDTTYKNICDSLIKYGKLKLEIVSARLSHPLIAEWQKVIDRAIATVER